jgi:hypothetical protein
MSKRIYGFHSPGLSRLYLIGAGGENESLPLNTRAASGAHFMAATGELIRLINYVDDITTTIRRIHASLPTVDADEKKRLAGSLRSAGEKIQELIILVEK